MTPDQRLNQIEPEVAEVLQKVDRLIESNGQILALAVNTEADLTMVSAKVNKVSDDIDTLKTTVAKIETTGNSMARGVANLTVSTDRQFKEVQTGLANLSTSTDRQFDEVRTGLTDLNLSTDQQFNELRTGQAKLEEGQSELRTGQARLEAGQSELRTGQVNLERTQQAILDFLRNQFR